GGDTWRRSVDGKLRMAASLPGNWISKPGLAARLAEVDAQSRDSRATRWTFSPCDRYLAQTSLLGHCCRRFLLRIPAIFYYHLASLLSRPRTTSFLAGHGEDSCALLHSRCRGGAGDGLPHRLLDSSRPVRRCYAQDSDGLRMVNGRRRSSGLLVGRATFLFSVADGSRCGIGNRKCKHLGVHADASRTASGGKVGGLAKRVRKSRRCHRTSSNRLHRGLDWSFSSGNRNHRWCLPDRCLGMAASTRRIQGGSLGATCRPISAAS